MAVTTQEVGPFSFTPINIWAMLRSLINNYVPIVTNNSSPTSGTSGSYAGQAGLGAILIDFINGDIYINVNTLASPTWQILFGSYHAYSWNTLTTNGAIPINQSRQYVITKAGILADTIAAPNASPAGDGVEILITSDQAFAHTLTFTGGTLDSGGNAVLTATWNANKGASLLIASYNSRWKVISSNGVSFS